MWTPIDRKNVYSLKKDVICFLSRYIIVYQQYVFTNHICHLIQLDICTGKNDMVSFKTHDD